MIKYFRWILFPFTILWYFILYIRHYLYNNKILRSYTTDLKSIGIGNLSLGGTGKTPMVEFILKVLKDNYNIAVISRGYGRKNNHFLEINEEMDIDLTGDEPMQILKKNTNTRVFVGSNRVDVYKKIRTIYPKIQTFIFDDVLQHRKINCTKNILLTNYNQLFTDDFLLPTGNLRDIKAKVKQVSCIVVSKCKSTLSKEESLIIKNKILKFAQIPIFFTCIKYQKPYCINTKKEFNYNNEPIIAISGLAFPKYFNDHINENYKLKKYINLADHHAFTEIEIINYINLNELIFITEKDAVKWEKFKNKVPNNIVFAVPIEIEFLFNEKFKFTQQLIS